MMEADEVLKLLDSYWFERRIFTHVRSLPTPAARFAQQIKDKTEECSEYRRVPNLRSMSDRCLGVSPDNFFGEETEKKPRLQKILSGKDVSEFSREAMETKEKVEKSREKRKKKVAKGISRSLSALEFEEVKGFMDLGFVFTDEDKNSSLVSVIPGLQKWGKMADHVEIVKGKVEVSRPYLSEAWGALSKRQVNGNKPRMNWRIPSLNNEVNVKDHLRVWAQHVASTVI